MSNFDAYAADYHATLNRGLAISGESGEFYARRRIAWLASCLVKLAFRPERVLDFGCGTGTSTRHFFEILGASSLVGVDQSPASLEVAAADHRGFDAEYHSVDEYTPHGDVDLAFCNGVFHHVPLDDRPEVMNIISKSLRPGGLFALWENNPWNPATRYIMSRIPFDNDAICLTGPETRRLAAAAGLRVMRLDYYFVFPAALRICRRLEPHLTRLPIGGQFQVLCEKP